MRPRPCAYRHLLPLILLLATASVDAAPQVYTGFFDNLAVGGHDVVAYFTEGRPVKGVRAYATEFRGATWRFSSAEHRDAFLADPDRYAPRYGGYCAWAVAQGDTAPGDPEFWTILDDRLYLNYDDAVQAKWNEDRAGFIERADAAWPAVLE